MQYSDKIAEDTLNFVSLTSDVVARMASELGVHQQGQKQAADLRSGALKHLKEAGVIAESDLEAVEVMLGSHAGSLNLLKLSVDKLVEERKERVKTASALGRGDGSDSSSPGQRHLLDASGDYDSLHDPVVGRRTSLMKASDRALLAGAAS